MPRVKKINKPVDEPLPEVVQVQKLEGDGVIVRGKGGLFLKGTRSPHMITSENAREMQASGVIKKREVMMQAANAEVPAELIAQYGAYAHVAERAQTLQRIASSPEAGKAAVMAHDALIRDTGMGEKQQQETQNAPLTLTEQALVGLIQAITAKVQAETVDGEVSDVE